MAEVQRKLNDYYKFVAELKSDNLRLSTEKSAAEQVLEEVRQDQTFLKEKLNKAQRVIEDSMVVKTEDSRWLSDVTAIFKGGFHNML